MDPTRRNRLIAGAVALAIVIVLALAFLLTRGSDEALIDASVGWHVNPVIAAELDVNRLRSVVEESAEEALGVRLTLVDLDESLLARAEARAHEIADEEGLPAAEARVAALLEREAATEAEADALLDEIDEADRDAEAVRARVSERVAAEHPLVTLPAGLPGALELTPAARYGASRLHPDEPWAVVPAGTAFVLYADDPGMRDQAIANHVLQSLGVLAGLSLRDGVAAEAMAANIDTAAGDHVTRDGAPVHFTDDERESVRRFLAAE